MTQVGSPTQKCTGCRDGQALDFAITMAFQPIFDIRSGQPWAYEALVRGADGTGASDILARVTEQNRYTFDQRCRVTAIEQAVTLGLMDGDARLSINFMPNAVYEPLACIRLTLKTAAAQGLPLSRLIFEFTEQEDMDDCGHIQNIVDSYKKIGLGTALDDFGAGYAGLNRLACLQTDVMKLDMELVRDIDTSMPRRMIVEAMVGLCRNMGMEVVAEGIETQAECDALRDIGIYLMQGYYLARPAINAFPAMTENAYRHLYGGQNRRHA